MSGYMEEVSELKAELAACQAECATIRRSYLHAKANNGSVREAAPELYEALKALEADYSRGANSGDWGSFTAEDVPEILAARAALLKAEGKQ